MHLISRMLLMILMVVVGIAVGPIVIVLCTLYKLYQLSKAQLTLEKDEVMMKNSDAMWLVLMTLFNL